MERIQAVLDDQEVPFTEEEMKCLLQALQIHLADERRPNFRILTEVFNLLSSTSRRWFELRDIVLQLEGRG